MKRLRPIAAVAIVLLLGSFMIHLARPTEPSFQGHRLSEWLNDYSPAFSNGMVILKPEAKRKAAEHAVKEIGTNAIPTLLRCLQATDFPMKTRLNSLLDKQHYLRFRFHSFEDTATLANQGFLILRYDALPAAPTLVQLIQSQDPKRRRWALVCLFCIIQKKDNFLPLILQSLHDSDRSVQITAANCVMIMYPEEAEKAGIYKMFSWMKPATSNPVEAGPRAAK